FGRTLGAGSLTGRNHNPLWEMSVTIGKPFTSGVIGGVGKSGNDYGALAIDSASGRGGDGGDLYPGDTLASFGKTMLAAVGADPASIDTSINGGKVVSAALA